MKKNGKITFLIRNAFFFLILIKNKTKMDRPEEHEDNYVTKLEDYCELVEKLAADRSMECNFDSLIAPINIEGKLNEMHFNKGWNRRFLVREENGILHVSLRNNEYRYEQALFFIKERKLYAISGIFSLHWASIKRIFKEEYKGIEIIGHMGY